jgi:hypothetical protein
VVMDVTRGYRILPPFGKHSGKHKPVIFLLHVLSEEVWRQL